MGRLIDLAKDSSGTFIRNIGWKGQPGAYKQPRFYLGKDRLQASIRASKLEQLWSAVETQWHKEGSGVPHEK